jgi:DnaK suppressor protein
MLRENRATAQYALNQSKPKPITPNRKAQLLQVLTQQFEDLTSKLQAPAAESALGAAADGDYADRASNTAGQSDHFAMRRIWQNMLAEVEQAISRLEQGTFGLCMRCERVIPEERLMAMPSAALCIDCARQQRKAKTY